MTQVHLNLSPDCIDKPTMSDIAGIEAMMLWPDDANQRRRLVDLANLEIMASRAEDYSQERLVEALRVAIRTPCREDIKPSWDKRLSQGLVAGMILYSAVQFSQLKKKPIPLTVINKFVVDAFKTERLKPLRIRLEPQTIKNNIWPRFRSVAHLWAASCWYIFPDKPEEPERTLDLNRPFVCPRSELGRFLGVSNSFCKQGEELRARRATSPILRKGESIHAPAEVEPPEIEVRFFPHASHH
jgi:hypothetical protein